VDRFALGYSQFKKVVIFQKGGHTDHGRSGSDTIIINSKSTIADTPKVPALPREAIERAFYTTGVPAQDI
jgi:hypothetical protein